MENYTVRFATIEDHQRLQVFYQSYYKQGHPLFNTAFWQWQYGNAGKGKSIIAEIKNGEIVGHLGCSMGGEIVWLINILINKNYSGLGLITAMFDMARSLGPIAVAMANPAGTGVLAKKKWYRYADLQRHVLINPAKANNTVNEWVAPIVLNKTDYKKPTGYYWEQPGIEGIVLSDGSTAVLQPAAGGVRMVDMVDANIAVAEIWQMGFSWIDHITSWNDPLAFSLPKNGWATQSPLPWYLNPVDFTMKVNFNLFSEEPLPRNFLFNRTYADIGRTGKIDAG